MLTKFLLGNLKRRDDSEIPDRIWENNIKMYLTDTHWVNCTDWINVAQDNLRCWPPVNTIMNLPSYVQCGEFLD